MNEHGVSCKVLRNKNRTFGLTFTINLANNLPKIRQNNNKKSSILVLKHLLCEGTLLVN